MDRLVSLLNSKPVKVMLRGILAPLSQLFIICLLPFLYTAEPFYRIRFGTVYSQRIGHLAINADTFLRRLKAEGWPPRTHYFFFGFDASNQQLFEMWQRLQVPGFRMIESKWGTRLMFAWRPILTRTRFWEKHRMSNTEYALYQDRTPLLSFTDQEMARGRQGLAEMGIGPDDWFVCFHVRDGAYFRKWRPQYEYWWQKNDFRNTNLDTFLKAAEYITSQGGFALRFGAHPDSLLPDTGNNRIIDYAGSYRDDFMDIFLAAHCRFFIGSCSGPDMLPLIFGVPVLSANHHPYNLPLYRETDIAIPRLLMRENPVDPVPFWEAQEEGFFTGWKEAVSHHSSQDLFELLPPDPDDILAGCKDMIDMLDGKPIDDEAKNLQDIYASQYYSHIPDYKIAGNVAPSFLKKHQALVERQERVS